MSWFFGSSSSQKSNIPPTTALQQQRLKQIESLRTFHNITEVQRDVEYRVTFNVGTSTVFLNITLPPQFPNDKPIVKVAPPLRHPWVNDQMVIVGCPSLLNFYMHSNLGKAIQEVAREFCEHPPQFLGSQATPPQSTTSVSGYQSPSQYSFPGYQPMHSPQSVASGSSGLNMPTSQYLHHAPVTSPNMGTISPLSGLAKTSNTSTSISGPAKSSSSFPELEHLSLEELKDLSDKAEVMDIFLSKLDLVKTLEANKEELIMKNEEIARYNMSLQPKLECSKDELIKKFERRSELKLEFVNNSKKQKDMTESLSLLAIRRQMELAATEAEESSEVIADEFLSQKIPPEEFVPKFLEKRKLCHSRKAKEEKVRSIHTRY